MTPRIRLGEVIEQDMIASNSVRTCVRSRSPRLTILPDAARRNIRMTLHPTAASAGARPVTKHLTGGSFWKNGKWFEVAVDGPVITNLKGLRSAGSHRRTRDRVQHSTDDRAACRCGPAGAVARALVSAVSRYYLCYPASRQMAPPLRAFIDSVRSKVSESGG